MNLAPALIQDASGGDQQAFVLLLEPLLRDAFRLAVGMLRSESDAEDAVQDGVLNAWRHFGRFRPGSDLRPCCSRSWPMNAGINAAIVGGR
jgi:DNA-directed RNA polymerase specialized sigma24 family protein